MGQIIGEIVDRSTTPAFLPSLISWLLKVMTPASFCMVNSMEHKSLEWMIYLKATDKFVCVGKVL